MNVLSPSWLAKFRALLLLPFLLISWPVAGQGSASPASSPPPNVQGRFDFNHDKTGFRLDGAHVSVRCESCHVEGIFRGTPKTCSQCHTQGNMTSTVIVQNPTAHINVIPGAACDTCHVSNTTFRIWKMDHSATNALCSTCHNGQSFEGVVPKTKSANHPQTSADCSLCHTSSLQTNSFESVQFQTNAPSAAASGIGVGSGVGFGYNIKYYDHSGVTGGCASCHNGSSAQGKPSGHIPTGLPCEQCHTTIPVQTSAPSSFSLHRMDHTGITTGCASCHNGQTFLGVAPMYKPAGHMPTTGACELCHNDTTVPGGFANVKGGAGMNPHDGTAGKPAPTQPCATCHNGSIATGQIAGHIQTNAGAQCGPACHSSSAVSFAAWNSPMDHTQVSSVSCSTCHATGKTFIGATMVTLPTGAAHIPTMAQCNTCHTSTTAFATVTMSHTGITSGCTNCHNTGAPYTYPGGTMVTKPAGHMPTAAACEACHTSTTIPNGFQTWTMSHTGIATGCASCHDAGISFTPWTGTALVTKPGGHIPTNSACETCHPASSTSVGGFVLPITGMNHTGISSNCASCHSGSTFTNVTPMSKPVGHVLTAQDCSACHTSTTIPGGFATAASNFDHVKAGVQPGTCTSCHNGTNATGMIGGHIAVNGGTQCDACHSYASGSFLKWTMDHSKVGSTCTNCHATGSTFPGATMVTIGTVNHFTTTAQCSTCHTSKTVPGGFATWTMDHAQVSTTCTNCHSTGQSFAGSVPIVTKPTGHIPLTGTPACDKCHTSTTVPNGFRTWTMDHTVAPATCSTCHNTGISFTPWNGTPALLTKGSGAPAHIPTSAECSTCHTSTTVTGGFAQWTMNHTGITVCTTCHAPPANTSFTNAVIVTKPAGHMVYSPATKECVDCHTSTSPGGFATSNTGGVNPHTGSNPGTCTNCHGNAAAVFPSAPAPGQPAGHLTATTTDCGACHSYTAASFTGWSTAFHANVSTTCANCHSAGKNFPGVTTMVTTASATHIPITGDCFACHKTTTVPTGFRTWTMDHSAVTTSPCATCHGSSASTFTNTSGTSIKTTTSPGVTHIPGLTGDCSACHSNTTVTGGFATWTMNHSAVTTTPCATCHAGTAGTYTNTSGLPIKTTASASPPHMVIGLADCSSCHSTTTPGGFLISSGHLHVPGDAGLCNTCHTGTGGGMVQISGHIPTGALSCDSSGCHAYANLSFANPIGPITTLHATLNNSLCAQCHKDTGNQTIGSSSLAAVIGKPAGHIPVPVNRCNNCHTTQTAGGFATFTMNHTTVAATACATCHDTSASFMASSPALVKKSSTHIPVTATCDQCHASTATGGFSSAWTMNHAAVAATPCATCHNTGVSFASYAGTPVLVTRSAGHIPTTAACDQCHASTTIPGGFATWTMNHTVVAGTPCTTCHNSGVSFAGWIGTPTLVTKSSGAPAHITTSAACDVCHTSTLVPGGFAQWTMNHSGVTTTPCTNCHDPSKTFTNATIVTKPVGHMTTTADCVTCHTNTSPGGFATFTGGGAGNPHTAANPGITCTNCHGNATASGIYTPAPGQPANHITVNGGAQCGDCHSYTSASFAGWTMNHTKVSGTCATCHATGKNFAGISAMVTIGSVTHIPVTGDCNVCHSNTTVKGGFAAWTMNHTGVTTTPCATCHAAGKSFTNTAGTPLKTNASTGVNHIPITGDCFACHKGATTTGGFATWTMDHTAVNATTCSTCHATGMSFTNTAGITLQTKPANHVPTTSECSTCHGSTYVSFVIAVPAASMSHAGISSGCANCHNGQTFQGVTPMSKPATHITTTGDCSLCHNPTKTSAGNFSAPNWSMTTHAGITTTPCAACHANGKVNAFQGATTVTQLPTHFPTTGDCGLCHTSFTSFVIASPFTGMVHSGGVNTGTCTTCHGTSAGITFAQGTITPKFAGQNAAFHATPSNYPTNCQTCHTSFSIPGGFLGAVSDHRVGTPPTAGTCATGCHATGASGAKQQISGHIPTGTSSCDSCHSYSSMSFAVPVAMNHAVVAATACSTCHRTTGNQSIGSSSLATLVGKPATHMTILGSAQCSLCHTNQTVPGGFAIWTMVHSGGVNTGTCQGCHSNNVFATGVVPVSKAGTHLTTTSDCSLCHASTVSFKMGSPTMNHAGLSSGCQNCHNGQVFQGVTPVSKPGTHIATLTAATDCAVCHSNTSTFTVWTMNHSGVSTATCTNCHNGQTFATGVKPVSKGTSPAHVTTALDCFNCHSGTTSFAGGRMGAAEHTANGNTATCIGCHNAQVFQGVTPVTKPGNHITTVLECATCHSTSIFTSFASPSWTMGSAQHSSNGNTAACINCHNGQVFATGVIPVNKSNTPSPGHVPTSSDCSNCHTNTAAGGFALFNSLKSKHSTVYMTSYNSTACYPTCHGTTSAIWFGAAYQALKSQSEHNPLGTKTNCKNCHSSTDSNW